VTRGIRFQPAGSSAIPLGIICDSLPSYLPTLFSLGFDCRVVYFVSPIPSCVWWDRLKVLHPHCQWASLPLDPLLFRTVQCWLLTGASATVPLQSALFSGTGPVLWIAPAGSTFTSSLPHHSTVRHYDTGGVLADSWEVASNRCVSSVKPACDKGVRGPLIKHIINPRLMFCSSQPWDGGILPEGMLSDEQQLSLDTLGVEICCRSVFSPTGKTIRRLSTLELMGAFDLGKILLPAGVNGDKAASVSQCPFFAHPAGEYSDPAPQSLGGRVLNSFDITPPPC
jgi:hypothetical protein